MMGPNKTQYGCSYFGQQSFRQLEQNAEPGLPFQSPERVRLNPLCIFSNKKKLKRIPTHPGSLGSSTFQHFTLRNGKHVQENNMASNTVWEVDSGGPHKKPAEHPEVQEALLRHLFATLLHLGEV